jgi:AcrR family transcriptional regulator
VAREVRRPVKLTVVAEAQHRRAGRPRLRPASDAGVPPRAEILGAAAELFAAQGLAATTTRQIADRVGIRQASLYHYFSGKDEILLELLTLSVRPSLRVAAALEARCADFPAAGLYALALADVRTLTRAPHNIGTLYLLPEVQGTEYEPFRSERAELQAIYGRLGRACTGDAALDGTLTGALIMQVVESVIHLRRTGEWDGAYAPAVAASCLRLAGLSADEVTRAQSAAENLIAALPGTEGIV